jgi:DNA-binding response OmpR family regulator
VNVLLVEDEDRIASFIEKGLRTRGFEVHRVATGAAALEEVRGAQGSSEDAPAFAPREGAIHAGIDVVVLDLGLPDVDGLDVLRDLREASMALPVLILTARGDVEDRVAGLDLGADDYIPKPVSIDELAARLRARLRPRMDPTLTRLIVGELELDLIARRARHTGRIMELTGREFALLEMLMRQAGRVVTREDLLSNVWGLDFDPRSNLVDVYVRSLRRKLGDGWIQTERGVGYRIAAPAIADAGSEADLPKAQGAGGR